MYYPSSFTEGRVFVYSNGTFKSFDHSRILLGSVSSADRLLPYTETMLYTAAAESIWFYGIPQTTINLPIDLGLEFLSCY